MFHVKNCLYYSDLIFIHVKIIKDRKKTINPSFSGSFWSVIFYIVYLLWLVAELVCISCSTGVRNSRVKTSRSHFLRHRWKLVGFSVESAWKRQTCLNQDEPVWSRLFSQYNQSERAAAEAQYQFRTAPSVDDDVVFNFSFSIMLIPSTESATSCQPLFVGVFIRHPDITLSPLSAAGTHWRPVFVSFLRASAATYSAAFVRRSAEGIWK